jgi:alpha-glucosidase
MPIYSCRYRKYAATDRMSYLPVLIETDKAYKILISEADLSDYPCMFLKSTGKNGMQSIFPKAPLAFGEDGDRSLKITEEADYIAKTDGKRSFPWRMMVISKEDKELIENEMVYNLSAPCVLEDYSWIKPGQVSWEWWHDARLYGVDFRSGFNMDSYSTTLTSHPSSVFLISSWTKDGRKTHVIRLPPIPPSILPN